MQQRPNAGQSRSVQQTVIGAGQFSPLIGCVPVLGRSERDECQRAVVFEGDVRVGALSITAVDASQQMGFPILIGPIQPPAFHHPGLLPLTRVILRGTDYTLAGEDELDPIEQTKADAVRRFCRKHGLVSWIGLKWSSPPTKESKDALRDEIRAIEREFKFQGSENFRFKIKFTQESWNAPRQPGSAPDERVDVEVPIHVVTGANGFDGHGDQEPTDGEDAEVDGDPGEVGFAIGGDAGQPAEGSAGAAANSGSASASSGSGGLGIAITGR